MRDRDWEEATEPLPGHQDGNSFDLGVDVLRVSRTIYARGLTAEGEAEDLWLDAAGGGLPPDFVVFEPSTQGLVDRLEDLGYPVRVARSGVDVMTLISDAPTAAVVCGPMRDADRRRLLTAAVKMRFPTVPVVYVTSHAGNNDAVEGAIREGAQAILPWPLPDAEGVDAVLCGFLRRPFASANAPPPAVDPATGSVVTRDELPSGRVPLSPASAPLVDAAPTSVTPPLERPSELKELLAALAPILWNLNDAARWAEELARKGDTTALGHASTLHIVGRFLDQLKGRLDDDE